MQIDESKDASSASWDEQVKAHEVLSSHTPNLTSSQSLGESLQESSSWMEERVEINAVEGC
jgi:hypothetical protein